MQLDVAGTAAVFQQLMRVAQVMADHPDAGRRLVDILDCQLAQFIQPRTGEQAQQR
jgi:hypothetical protein